MYLVNSGLSSNGAPYQLLVESAQDFIFALDPNFNILYVNQFACHLLNRPLADIVGKNISIIFDNDDLSHQKINLTNVLNRGLSFSAEDRMTFNGRKIWLNTTLIPIIDPRLHKVTTILGYSRDITDIKRVNLALRKSQKELKASGEYFRALVENSSEGIILLDAKANFLYKSPSTAKVTGYPADRFIHTNAFSLIHPDDIPSTQKSFQALYQEPDIVVSGEFRLLHQNQQYIWVHFTATNRLSNPSIKAIVVNLHDITKEKQVDLAKSEFVSLASHQLRSPLSGIHWFLEMLLDNEAGSLKPKQRELLDDISHAANRMTDLVNSLLDISRLETGRFVLEKTNVSFKKILELCIAEVGPKVIEKNHTLITYIPANLPLINIDTRQITNIIINLLINSIKYTPPNGQISLSVSLESKTLIIKIKDNGLGIPEDEQNRVFEKFYRGRNVIHFDSEGTGLGLYVVKKIIETWGGQITFESKEGKGTIFIVTLPID